MITWRVRWFCNCRHPWCWLDTLFACHVRAICDRHDARIRQP